MADRFADRHIGTHTDAQATMLAAVGYASVDELLSAAVPSAITAAELASSSIPAASSERAALAELRELAGRNTVNRSLIGLGYFDTITPAVIKRNVLENPSWYTAYTPYQPEISQGRLEALINFQTMVSDLTGLDTANASMLDESTAVVEGMLLARPTPTRRPRRSSTAVPKRSASTSSSCRSRAPRRPTSRPRSASSCSTPQPPDSSGTRQRSSRR
jgi:glycine dehydrogenase